MTLLLDTQVVLWLGERHPRVPAALHSRILEADEPILLSAIVHWEVAIKSALGKLTIADDFRERTEAYDFLPLPVSAGHAWAVRNLPLHHRDPFDRLLVAQAQIEGATLVTADSRLAAYDVPVLWDPPLS